MQSLSDSRRHHLNDSTFRIHQLAADGHISMLSVHVNHCSIGCFKNCAFSERKKQLFPSICDTEIRCHRGKRSRAVRFGGGGLWAAFLQPGMGNTGLGIGNKINQQKVYCDRCMHPQGHTGGIGASI